VQARIPAGVADGQRIRLKGRGAPGRNGGPPGDLIVECHVAGDSLFGRDGHNLTVRVPVTFAEAALGGDIDVPTLDGPPVMLRLRPGTQSGSRHRVKGKGIVTKRSTGDLIVTVDVQIPTHLNAEQRTAVEALAAATTVSPRTRLES
jgi:molecular chaperone DnaJ